MSDQHRNGKSKSAGHTGDNHGKGKTDNGRDAHVKHPSRGANPHANARDNGSKSSSSPTPADSKRDRKQKQQAARPGREAFLPLSSADMQARGWDQCDFVYVCGDAYVDHPSFGMAIITRVLEAHGYKVGIICQPDWNDPESITEFGEPRLGFLVSAGNMDSMVNHYTVAKKHRSKDYYTPGGEMGARPNRACIVYSNLIRRTYKHTPIILGGIEASLRRLAHYDYWADDLKRSVLMDSGADLLVYGMGEKCVVEVADALAANIPVSDISWIRGTVYKTRSIENVVDADELPSFDDLRADKLNYARSFAVQQRNMDAISARGLIEHYPEDNLYVVQNPPQPPLTTAELDAVFELPYARAWHPDYDEAGGVPAFDFDEVRFSIASNRGCFGECSFCALTFHQGRVLQSRSYESIMAEARILIADPAFKGYITDVGGPTANFTKPACEKQKKHGVCQNRRCLWPEVCPNMDVQEDSFADLLSDLRQLPGVKKVFVRSGIRFDYTLADKSDKFLNELIAHHVSGQLRLAPEHVSNPVLAAMGKPNRAVYEAFCQRFEKVTKKAGLEQYVVPYLMSSHPGSTLKEAVELAEAVRDMGYMPEQVQDFYPTPSTMSTAMYYTGVDPRTMEPIYVPTDPHEKAMQRALIQYRKPENWKLVHEALVKAGRTDLIGFGSECLIRPRPPKGAGEVKGGRAGTANGRSSGSKNGGALRENASRHGRDGAPAKSKGGSKQRAGKAGLTDRKGSGHAGGGRAQRDGKGMTRAQHTAARNRAAQGRQGANKGRR